MTRKECDAYVNEIAFRVLRVQPNMVLDHILCDALNDDEKDLESLLLHVCNELDENPGPHLINMRERLKKGDESI